MSHNRFRIPLIVAALSGLSLLSTYAADTFTTATGAQGADSFVDGDATEAAIVQGTAEPEITRTRGDSSKPRKAYYRFDLSTQSIPAGELASVTLTLTRSDTEAAADFGTGLQLQLWGIIDGENGDAPDDWNEGNLTWNSSLTAAQNDGTEHGMASGASLLGTFAIDEDWTAGDPIEFNNSNAPQLLAFLQADTNQLVTLVTTYDRSEGSSLKVATKEHPTFAAPTLTLSDELPNDSPNVSGLWQDFVDAKANGTEAVLPDFSYAGYHYCEVPIPDIEAPVFDVTDYGAIPDDGLSDEVAIQATIDACASSGGGVVFFPSGRFDLGVSAADDHRILMINSSNMVLRGSGSGDGGTELFMARSFYQSPNGEKWKIQVRPDNVGEPDPKDSGALLATITDGSTTSGILVPRESFEIPVDDPTNLAVGDRILIRMPELWDPSGPNPNSTVTARNREIKEWYMNPRNPHSAWDNPIWFKEYHEITAIQGNTITLREPLRMDIRAQDDWSIWAMPTHLEEVGVEDIRFRGNWHGVHDHGSNSDESSGFNLLFFRHVVDGWVRRCEFHDTFNTLKFELSARISLLQTDFYGVEGHKAMASETCWSLLMGIGRSYAPHYHVPSYDDSTTGFVLWRYDYTGSSYDPHGEWNIANLNDASRGSFIRGRMGTGSADLPNHLRQLVFWNLENADGSPGTYLSDATFDWWYGNYWHQSVIKPIIVGLHGKSISWVNANDLATDESHGTPVQPESLFEAQLEHRLGAVPNWLLELYRPEGSFIHSTTAQQGPNTASKLLDGDSNASSRWSASGFPQSVVIDFRQRIAFTRAQLAPYQNRGYQYIIEVSDSPNSGYSTLVDRSNNGDGEAWLVDDFDYVNGRFVRLTVTGATGYAGDTVAINEIILKDALGAYFDDFDLQATDTLDSDDDGDTLKLLTEYAFGLDPTRSDAAGLTQFEWIATSETTAPALSFRQRINDPSLVFTIWESEDLVDWDPVNTTPVASQPSGILGVNDVTLKIDSLLPGNPSRAFYHVEITR